MKKILIIIFTALLVFSWRIESYAHILETNQSIGAVMHIDPDDDPIIGSPATIFFDIHDKNKKFKPEACNCTASIVQNEKVLFTQPLFLDKSNSALLYTFTSQGEYEIRLTGDPKQKDEFQKFEIEFPVTVSRVAQVKPSQSSGIIYWLGTHIYHAIAGVIIIAVSLVFLVLKLTGRMKRE